MFTDVERIFSNILPKPTQLHDTFRRRTLCVWHGRRSTYLRNHGNQRRLRAHKRVKCGLVDPMLRSVHALHAFLVPRRADSEQSSPVHCGWRLSDVDCCSRRSGPSLFLQLSFLCPSIFISLPHTHRCTSWSCSIPYFSYMPPPRTRSPSWSVRISSRIFGTRICRSCANVI